MFKFKKLLSCGKVMFLHLSVILFMGGGSLSRGSLSRGLCRGVSIQAGLLGERGVCVRRGPLSRGASVQGGGSLSMEGALSGKPPKR